MKEILSWEEIALMEIESILFLFSFVLRFRDSISLIMNFAQFGIGFDELKIRVDLRRCCVLNSCNKFIRPHLVQWLSEGRSSGSLGNEIR